MVVTAKDEAVRHVTVGRWKGNVSLCGTRVLRLGTLSKNCIRKESYKLQAKLVLYITGSNVIGIVTPKTN